MNNNHHHYFYGGGNGPVDPLQFKLTLAMIALGIGLVLAYNYLLYIEDWRTFGAPYKYVAAFYFYMITIPLDTATTLVYDIAGMGLTKYYNINRILGWLGLIAYIFGIGFIIFFIASIIKKVTYIPKRVSILFYFFGPLIFIILWYVVSRIFAWVFAT